MSNAAEERKKRFINLMTFLGEQCSREVESYTIAFYAKNLSEYNFDNVNKALEEIAKKTTRFPTIDEIKNEMGIETTTPKQLSVTLATRLSEAARKFGRINIRQKRDLILNFVGDPKLVCFTSEEGLFSLYQSLADDKITVQQCAANLSNRISKLPQEKVDEINHNIEHHSPKTKASSEDIKEQAMYVRSNFANDKEHQKKVDEFKASNNQTLSDLKYELKQKVGALD